MPGATVAKALEGAFIIMCADGAVHTALGKCRSGIITYSLVLVSRYLIEVLKQYPSSAKNIMVHVQLNGTETVKSDCSHAI